MKITLLLTMYMAVFSLVSAQVSIQPSVPATGIFQKNQLWNIVIVNSSRESFNCRLELVVRERSSGQEIFTGASNQFTLTTGVRQINFQSVSPIQYNYLMPGITRVAGDFISPGSFIVCYSLSRIPADEVKLAEECVSFDADPLSPPFLVNPPDSSLMDYPPVSFNWIPPTPSGMFNQLTYDIIFAEIKDGQMPTEAIQNNIPFYSEGNYVLNVLNYPTSMPSFEKGKWYAWQVVAKDGQQYAGKSEIWVFKISDSSKSVSPLSYSFIDLSRHQNNIKYLISGSNVHIKYFSTDPEFNAAIEISRPDGKIVYKTSKVIKQGDNFLQLETASRLVTSALYTLTLHVNRTKKYQAAFSIQ